MTTIHCTSCSRGLAEDVAFCPYCGADRTLRLTQDIHAPAAAAATPSLAPAPSSQPPLAPAARREAQSQPPLARPAVPQPVEPPARPAKKRGGCGLQLLVLLMLVAGALAYCAVRPREAGGIGRGALPAAGAVASRPIRVSKRWRHVRLPDAGADARFAVTSEVPLRVRAAGRSFAVKPGRPLELPQDTRSGFDLRAADYVSSADAASAEATLSTLPPR